MGGESGGGSDPKQLDLHYKESDKDDEYSDTTLSGASGKM